MRYIVIFLISFISLNAGAQLDWKNVDSLYGPLPKGVHVYFSNTSKDTSRFRAYYLIADLKNKHLDFVADTTYKRRLTPSQFYEKSGRPLAVVNTSFFSYETNQNLNIVANNGSLLAYNKETIYGRGKDTFTYRHPFNGSLGIFKNRKADVAWVYTDTATGRAYASQEPVAAIKDSIENPGLSYITSKVNLSPWRVKTAVGGGPVLLQNGDIKISNNEEMKFSGKAINDKHPRTAIGYTANGSLIILVVEGRSESASGATLGMEAEILKELGCVEALNLDGGGSSCLLINGKETIKISDKEGQRPVPGVFLIKVKK